MIAFLEILFVVLSSLTVCTFAYSVITRRYNLALLVGVATLVFSLFAFLCDGYTFAYSLFYSATVFCILGLSWMGVEVMWFMRKWYRAKKRGKQFNRDFIPSKAFLSFFFIGMFAYIGITQISVWLM